MISQWSLARLKSVSKLHCKLSGTILAYFAPRTSKKDTPQQKNYAERISEQPPVMEWLFLPTTSKTKPIKISNSLIAMKHSLLLDL
jgi:hypothetical protein